MGSHEQAIRNFLNAQKLGKKDVSALLNFGNAFKESGQYSNAPGAYNDILKINPGNMQVKNNLVMLYGLMGDTERSGNAYRQAQQDDRRQDVLLYHQAVDLMKTSEFDKAIPLLLKASNIKPDFPGSLQPRLTSYMLTDAAEADMRGIIRYTHKRMVR